MALADISDFANAKATGCDGFTPAIRQAFPGKRDAWAGVFESGGHRLEVIGDLEPIGQKSSGARAPIWSALEWDHDRPGARGSTPSESGSTSPQWITGPSFC
ncbi:hypothetical protein SNK19_13055 [Ralstonia pseudosolanacearum]|uniref:hypothetical protein n=1 Tax=Ralstonia pseudosolanacearum TaxID=1310165 RepID=UPI0033977C61